MHKGGTDESRPVALILVTNGLKAMARVVHEYEDEG